MPDHDSWNENDKRVSFEPQQRPRGAASPDRGARPPPAEPPKRPPQQRPPQPRPPPPQQQLAKSHQSYYDKGARFVDSADDKPKPMAKTMHVPAVEERPSFQELKSIERHRREILLRAELPFWRILLFWSGTCLKEISTDLLVYLTLGVYVAIRIVAYAIDYVPESAELLEKTNIGVLGGFLSFFLVLFVNQTNGRFLEMYGFSKACSGRIQDVAGLARTQLPPELGDRLVRHFNAAHVAGYVGINAIGQGSPYSKAHFFDVYNDKHGLLDDEEMRALSKHDWDNSGLAMKELCTWCQEDIVEAKDAGYLDTIAENYMHDRVLAFRAAMDGMYDYTDQPPHFFYIHFLVLLSVLYLPLFAIDTAYAAGWGEETYIGLDVLQGLIVFLQCIFVTGLRSLATKMIDPYGDDLEDLSVICYVESTIEICDTIMTSEQPPRAPPKMRAGGKTTTMGAAS